MSGGAGRGGSLESQDSTASRSSDEPGEEALSAALAAGTAQLLDDADLPTAIHVTNLPLAVFDDPAQKVGTRPLSLRHSLQVRTAIRPFVPSYT